MENDELESQLQLFQEVARKVGEHGLVRGSSGNLSSRLDEEKFLISASRSWMADFRKEQIAICNMSDGECVNDLRPSVETGLHWGILKARKDVNVVLHFQSIATTAAACQHNEVNYHLIPEIPHYIGDIGTVPFIVPGTEGLAKAVVAAITDHDLVVMVNHGIVVVGGDYDDVLEKALFFDLVCEVLLRSGQLEPRALTETVVKHFLSERIQRKDKAV